ncbi:MAG: AbrB/MazE/SpoVT family DNA-binding domain-containing protein [Candidatus Aenigmarchaeota archaeon]|nr:AbrB/MazE/SpoVT family DNA-binding domain-containing protein [Candidatus Aenigmarchaeota archaeon]
MKKIETKISIGGRIVIPKEIRKKLGIQPGSKAIVTLRDREIVVKPKEIIERPVERLWKSVKVKPEVSPKKVAREWLKKHL